MFNLSSFLIYVFIMAYTPGPNNIMSMSNAARFGFKRSFPFNVGVFAGFIIVMLLCALFSAMVFQYIPKIKVYMLSLGAAYMLYLAWKTWQSAPDIAIPDEMCRAGFLSGMILQFINPKIYIYAVTAMSSYILPVFDSPFILSGFAVILAFIGFTSTVCWAFFGAAFRKIFAERTKMLDGILSLLLVYCAVSLFF